MSHEREFFYCDFCAYQKRVLIIRPTKEDYFQYSLLSPLIHVHGCLFLMVLKIATMIKIDEQGFPQNTVWTFHSVVPAGGVLFLTSQTSRPRAPVARFVRTGRAVLAVVDCCICEKVEDTYCVTPRCVSMCMDVFNVCVRVRVRLPGHLFSITIWCVANFIKNISYYKDS